MLKIDCPWCGPRGENEFTYGGEAGTVRPIPATAIDDAIWARYLYIRRNEKGAHRELWCHSGGCKQWFVMLRDTVTHAIAAIEKIGSP
ncbi:MAG TPA: sarcosine oxidase subunit delta [Magnetospirillaceae bacterium]|jgi:heterotetrameric sarcosine oxidase delta subunit